MPRLAFVSIVAAVLAVTVVPRARGELPHSMGRYLGVGWGDGYHSRAGCPPKRHIAHQAVLPGPLAVHGPTTPTPWWKIPADGTARDVELLPHPAGIEPAPTGTSPATGPSLFRQPGEGSSVSAPSVALPAEAR